MIINYIKMGLEEHDSKLENKIHANENYKKCQEQFYNILGKIDENMMFALEESAICMETLSRDISYDIGFSEGIKFIINSLNGGKGEL